VREREREREREEHQLAANKQLRQPQQQRLAGDTSARRPRGTDEMKVLQITSIARSLACVT